ncbi:MAG: ABC transporter permease, partial [Gemmatimonadetes bacterium]|nr:ABC transporter permease [Gemmatimonadota bacterium]
MIVGPVNTSRLWQLVRKEFRQMLRDPRSQRMLFISPIVQLLLFGYAVTTDVRDVKTWVVDYDHTALSRELVQSFQASGHFRVVGYGERPQDLIGALDHGDALVGLEIPRGFSAELAAGRPGRVQVLLDGTSSNTANVAQGYATQIIQRFGLVKGGQAVGRAGVQGVGGLGGQGVDLRARAWYNPNLTSQVYNVPGVIGTIVMLMGLLLTSLAVVREREIGTLEQLMVSPLAPSELILGKTLPVVFVAFTDLVLITAVAMLWFDIPFRGSFALLLFASVFYILSGLGLGLLISTVSNTQQEAFMSMFFFFLPAIILSGYMYPIENMAAIFRWETLLNPNRHYQVVVRGIF